MSADALNALEQTMDLVEESNVNPAVAPQQPVKKKRKLAGTPDPDSVVVALSPESLLAKNQFVCDICNKGFQRDQNLQLHRRGHNLPWKLPQRDLEMADLKKVYVCPEPTCIYHQPSRALGDLSGIKKHYCRKHGEKKWKCSKCSKCYAVLTDMKAHQRICGTREHKCKCGNIFTRKDFLAAHQSYCAAMTSESVHTEQGLSPSAVGTDPTIEPDEAAAVFSSVHDPSENADQMLESRVNSEAPPQNLAAVDQQDNNLSLCPDDNPLHLNATSIGTTANAPSYMADASARLIQFLPLVSSSSILGNGEGSSTLDPMHMPCTDLSLSSMQFALTAVNNTKGKGKEVAAPVGSLLAPQYNTNKAQDQHSAPAVAELSATAMLQKANLMGVSASHPVGSSLLSGPMSSSRSVYGQVERDVEFELFRTREARSFQELIMGLYPALEMRKAAENNSDQPVPELPSYMTRDVLGLGGSGGSRSEVDPS